MKFCIQLAVVTLFCCSTWAFPIPWGQKRALSSVPQYVLGFAPLVWMDPQEQFFPTDISTFLANVRPTLNGANVGGAPNPLTLQNLDDLTNSAKDIYLATNDDFSKTPQWIKGTIPGPDGRAGGTVSSAIVVHDRGGGQVDAFYFYFFAYNRGNTVLSQELGSHVGDWEHTMVRFQNGQPKTAWLSAHSAGGAFKYSALEKQGNRAVVYSARGSHANFATSGSHDHTIPGLPLLFGPLLDTTGRGKLWDPVKNAAMYSVSFPDGTKKDDSSNPTFTSLSQNVPADWLSWIGRWGDNQLPNKDPRQKDFFGFKKFTAGPTGPRDKKLNRSRTCPSKDGLCVEWDFLPPGS